MPLLSHGSKKIAVVCAQGIGDGLIMHIASHHLTQKGHAITTFNDHLAGFGKWLPGYHFLKQPDLETIEKTILFYDAIILQHDNTPKAKALCTAASKNNLQIFRFYGSYTLEKHGILTPLDYVCNPNQTMVLNIENALLQWSGSGCTKNGLTPPPGLLHKKHPLRIAIHPGSNTIEKNWPLHKFIQVSQILKNQGLEPIFLLKKNEQLCRTLEELATFIYESGAFLGNDSGPGHLASYLNIPTLIIAKEEKHMRLWAPGWYPSLVITPPKWLSHWKLLKNKWKYFISKNKIIKSLKNNILNN